jgi:hypothetical protein
MGFNDTATYVRADDAAFIGNALAPLLRRIGFVPAAEGTMDDSIASYDSPHKLKHLAIWAKQADPKWWRLYSNAPGLFTWHDGDGIPFLQRLAKQGDTEAFELSVNDGDSICVLETQGTNYRLTGAPSYVMDALYEQDKKMSFKPGSVFPLKGVRLAYQALEVDAQLIEELIGYDFGFDMQDAISGFEEARFGNSLDYYHFTSPTESDAIWHYQKKA